MHIATAVTWSTILITVSVVVAIWALVGDQLMDLIRELLDDDYQSHY